MKVYVYEVNGVHVRIKVDMEAICGRVARQAYRNKSKRAQFAGGSVTAVQFKPGGKPLRRRPSSTT